MIHNRGSEAMFDLSPAEFFALGVRSQSKILEWRGERILGPLLNGGSGHSIYQVYRFLIEKIDHPDGRVKEIKLLNDLKGLGRYLKGISLSLEDNKLVIDNDDQDPPPEKGPAGQSPPGKHNRGTDPPGDSPPGNNSSHTSMWRSMGLSPPDATGGVSPPPDIIPPPG